MVIFLGMFITVVVIILLSRDQQKASLKVNEINSFEECVKEGGSVMESYPRQCANKNGKLFIEQVVAQECGGVNDCPVGLACINHTCQKLSK